MTEYERPAALSDEETTAAYEAEAHETDEGTPAPAAALAGNANSDAAQPTTSDAAPSATGDAASVPSATNDVVSATTGETAEDPSPDGSVDAATGDPVATAPLTDDELDDPDAENAVPAPPIWSTATTNEPTPSVPAAHDTESEPVPTPGRTGLLRPRNLVLIGGAAAVLILAAIFTPIAWELWHEKDVTITTPNRVAGLVLDDSQGARDTIDYLRTAVETGVSLQKSTGAVYADEAGQSRSVLFIGGSGVLVSPDQALSKTFGLIADDSGGVDGVHTVAAGPLGGVMKCGSTQTDGGSMAVCGWADHGSLGIAMFPNRPVDESADLLRTMRKSMQSRS